MPLIVGIILWVGGVTAAVAIAAYGVDRGKLALPAILLVLAVTVVVGLAAYAVDKSTAREERKE